MTGIDPVAAGLVASLARPGGNLTGVNFLSGELTAKRLGVLRELIPGATRFAVLLNTVDIANSETTMRDVETSARPMGLQLRFLNVGTNQEITAAFASFVRERPDALLIGSGPYFYARRVPRGWRPPSTMRPPLRLRHRDPPQCRSLMARAQG